MRKRHIATLSLATSAIVVAGAFIALKISQSPPEFSSAQEQPPIGGSAEMKWVVLGKVSSSDCP